jgi:hypothetical protein
MLGSYSLGLESPPLEEMDVPSCNFGDSPGKNPDIAASHGPSMMPEPCRPFDGSEAGATNHGSAE